MKLNPSFTKYYAFLFNMTEHGVTLSGFTTQTSGSVQVLLTIKGDK